MSEIGAKRDDLLRARFPLGAARSPEQALPDGGRLQQFEQGTIYASGRSGAHVVSGAFREAYEARGGPGGRLGYPISDPHITRGRRAEAILFERGSLYLDRAFLDHGVYYVPPEPIPCNDVPLEHGRWELLPFDSGVVGIHAALMPGNKVLFFTYLEPPGCEGGVQEFGDSVVLDLKTGHPGKPSVVRMDGGTVLENVFCAGQAFLGDGRLVVVGGDREDEVETKAFRLDGTVRAVQVFAPGGAGGGTWRHVADCARGRWYCTCATLPDGRILIVGGSARATTNGTSNATFEIYDAADDSVTAEEPIPDAEFSAWSSYPFVITLPGNRALIHFGTRTRFLDLKTLTFDSAAVEAAQRPVRWGRTYGVEGTAVLLPLLPTSTPPYAARVMIIGGGSSPDVANQPATPTCELLDLSGPLSKAKWVLKASMANPRVMPDAVLLPDGTVFVCNGSRSGQADGGKEPVFEAEIYDPEKDQWTAACHMSVPRLYHATAILLADGRVLTAGTDCAWNPAPYSESQLKLETYSPPYVFKNRPNIGKLSGSFQHGDEVEVPTTDGDDIAFAALIRCSAVTHSFNSDQRYVGLSIVEQDAGKVVVSLPGDSAVAPPGPYLLFLLDAQRVPSIGRRILIEGYPKPLKRNIKQEVDTLTVKDSDFNPPDPRSLVENLLDRVTKIEAAVARMSAFIELHERPLYGAHGTGNHPQGHPGQGGGDAPAPTPPPHEHPSGVPDHHHPSDPGERT